MEINKDKLKPKQRTFITEYLSNGSIAETCRIIGITQATAHSWLNNGLRDIINDMQNKLFEERIDKQCALLDKSTEKLADIIEDEKTAQFIILNVWKALNESVFRNKQCVDVQKQVDELKELYRQQEESNEI